MQAYRAMAVAAIVLCQILMITHVWAQTESAGTREVDAYLRAQMAGLPAVSPDDGFFGHIAGVVTQRGATGSQQDELTRMVEAFYAARDFHAAWQDPATVSAFVAALYTLENDGLQPDDYGAATLAADDRRLTTGRDDTAQRARFDIATTRSYLTVLKHLNRGKVDPASIDPEWDVPLEPFTLDMAAVSHAVDTLSFETAFALARPAYAPYERLRAGLARYRAIERAGGWQPLPSRTTALRPGDHDPDVVNLRQRLAAIGEAVNEVAQPSYYDDTLAAAVERFQRNQYLAADGVIGTQTRAALNVSVQARINQIRINLERARWLLHGLPRSYVLVDIAGFQLTYYAPDGRLWRTRIVVGQPYRKTPSLRSTITYLTFNPTWTVPQSIIRQEMVPRIRRDPGYLAREHLQVLTSGGEQLDPATIDWQQPPTMLIRQEAGADNALGRVVFRFPNPYMVYLHDTPAQGLFAQPQRAFSHGCMRVENALELARLLLNDPVSWRAEDIARVVTSGKTQSVSLPSPVPVIIHYWTVNVAEDGTLAFKPDIYHRDRALLAALDRPQRR